MGFANNGFGSKRMFDGSGVLTDLTIAAGIKTEVVQKMAVNLILTVFYRITANELVV